MPVLARPGGSIHYQVSGSGSPALLLTHGFAATSAHVRSEPARPCRCATR